MVATMLLPLVQRRNDCTFCHSNGNLNNHDNHGVKTMIFRTWGKEDIFFLAKWAWHLVQIDACTQGNDIFDYLIYLCQT